MTDSPMTAPAAPSAPVGEVLSGYLTTQAGAFLRALPQAVGEAGSRPGSLPASAAGADDLLRAARRIGGALHTFGPSFDPGWSAELRTELRWLLDLLGREPGFRRRAARLLAALDSLSDTAAEAPGMLAGHAGGPKARALLERQLTLSRTRAHTSLLQELRSARLHALADRMTILTGDVPLLDGAVGRSGDTLVRQAAAAFAALAAGTARLPLERVVRAYGGGGLHRLASLPAARADSRRVEPSPAGADADALLAADDEPWHRVRVLLKRTRYALEVCSVPTAELDRLAEALDRHRDASDAAATASLAARTPRIMPATAYVLGVVHADQRLEVEAARYAFGHQWPKLPQHGWHEWATA